MYKELDRESVRDISNSFNVNLAEKHSKLWGAIICNGTSSLLMTRSLRAAMPIFNDNLVHQIERHRKEITFKIK